MRLREFPALVAGAFHAWRDDRAERLAAALAYYTLFSIAPLLIVAVAIAGMVFGPQAARGQIAGQFQQTFGPQAAAAIQAMIASAYRPSAGVVATVIGIGTLLLGAAGVFGQIQDAFNTMWRVKPEEHAGIWDTVKSRFLSFAMVLGVGFILMVSLVSSAVLSAASKYVGDRLPGSELLWRLLELGSSFVVVSLLFAMLYKVLPDAPVQWRDVAIGACTSSALFTIGKYLIGLYLGRSSVASAYGAAGSMVVLLLWVYYAAQILYFGAEVTRVYSERHGSRAAGQVAPYLAPVPAPAVATLCAGMAPVPAAAAVAARTERVGNGDFGKEIRIAGLVGAALGVAFGLLRPAQFSRDPRRGRD